MRRFVRFCAVLGLCAATGCAEVKPVVRTAVDIARDLCALVVGDRYGISTEEAALLFCATEHQLEPWLEELLAAEQRASARADGDEP